MSELDEAVHVLLSETPPRPGLEDLEGRARRRRIRYATTIIVSVVVIAAATAAVAGTVGHGASSPHIAVSPTTAPNSHSSGAACAFGTLRQQEDDLKAQATELNNALGAAERNHSPDRDTIDAHHQAVLRQLESVDQTILALQIDEGAIPDLDSTPPPVNPDTCDSTTTTNTVEPATAWCHDYNGLDSARVALKHYADTLNTLEDAAMAAQSPNLGQIDAQHQAVLRELEDVETRIIHLEEAHPVPVPKCP